VRNPEEEEREEDKMKNIESLMKKATELKAEGLVEGQISEELNVSSETVTWLLTHAEKTGAPGPKDISVDWSMLGRSAYRLGHISQAMSDMIYECLDASDAGVDVVVGIALSGLPLASLIANDLCAELAVYTPSKQMLSQDPSKKLRGNLSTNFSEVREKECVVVDDVITTGRTIEEAVEHLDEHGAKINAIAVLIDKKGTDRIAGVPVTSLLKVIRVN
jgi:orotate phosphoribosyltransferase